MKRLTVNETWNECLAMWKWISRRCKGKGKNWCYHNTDRLKFEFLEKEGVDPSGISCRCFFCDRASPIGDHCTDMCSKCPAGKIEKGFHCNYVDHGWEETPRLFYAKLKELNRIRLSK